MLSVRIFPPGCCSTNPFTRTVLSNSICIYGFLWKSGVLKGVRGLLKCVVGSGGVECEDEIGEDEMDEGGCAFCLGGESGVWMGEGDALFGGESDV